MTIYIFFSKNSFSGLFLIKKMPLKNHFLKFIAILTFREKENKSRHCLNFKIKFI